MLQTWLNIDLLKVEPSSKKVIIYKVTDIPKDKLDCMWVYMIRYVTYK